MESQSNMKIVFSKPIIQSKQEAQGLTGIRYVLSVDISQPECRKVEKVSVSPEVLTRIKETSFLKDVTSEEDGMLTVNLFEWTEPEVGLQVGISIDDFFVWFAEKALELFVSKSDNFKEEWEKLPLSYGRSVLT